MGMEVKGLELPLEEAQVKKDGNGSASPTLEKMSKASAEEA